MMKLPMTAMAAMGPSSRNLMASPSKVPRNPAASVENGEVGLHLKVPFIERVAKTVSLKEQVVDFDPQPVITKDNVTMQGDDGPNQVSQPGGSGQCECFHLTTSLNGARTAGPSPPEPW